MNGHGKKHVKKNGFFTSRQKLLPERGGGPRGDIGLGRPDDGRAEKAAKIGTEKTGLEAGATRHRKPEGKI